MPNRKWLRSGFVWLLLLVAVSVLWFAFAGNRPDAPRVDFNTSVIADVKRGEVERLIAQEGSSEVRV
ncbi:MAG: cell division protein FtsH, partial [Chloroflexia bacterium]|nr:cell division protein FtsH [Chloroflexia bacterium]